MPTQRQARDAFKKWDRTGTLDADKETHSMIIKMMVHITDAAIGIEKYSLMVQDAIRCRYELEDMYKARYGEPWNVKEFAEQKKAQK